MTCMTQKNLTPTAKQLQQAALKRLLAAIADGSAQVVIGRNGAIAFKGWRDNAGVSDVCAYRALMNSPEMRKAVARAEVTGGVKLSRLAVATGVHSHDGGSSWHSGH
jgi:hypothetical protein